MEVKKAEKNDHLLLTEIAFLGKSFWKYSSEQMEMWREQLTITETYIEKHQVYKLLQDEKTLGFFSLILKKNKESEIDFLFMYPLYIGKDFGKILVETCIEKAKELNVEKILVEADPNAESFYKHFGFTTYNSLESSIKNRFLPQMELLLV